MTSTLTLFIQSPPGLSEFVLEEWNEKALKLDISFKIIKFEQSGVEIESNAQDLAKLLPYLKTPNRVLIRLDHFKARDFPKLFSKAKKFPWHEWMADVPEKIRVTSQQSRLIHTDRIEITMRDAIAAAFKAQPPKKINQQRWSECPSELFVRVLDDEVLISIDAAGERLGVRGYRSQVGPAPLRENLAAACLLAFLKNDLFQNDFTLADPMMGSGCFLIEASQWQKPNLSRNFYLHHWMQKRLPTQELSPSKLSFIGSDIDGKMVESTKENFASLDTKGSALTFYQENLLESQKSQPETNWVISNPPYGERLEIRPDFFKNLIPALKKKFPKARIALLLPNEKWDWTKAHTRKIVDFKNGGMEVSLRELIFN